MTLTSVSDCNCVTGIGFAHWGSGTRERVEEVGPLRVGSLFRCKKCGTRWFVDAFQERMWTIGESRAELFEAWCRCPLVLEPNHEAQLLQIGAPKIGIERDISRSIEIPCRVTTRTGSIVDPAVVCFSDHPPIENWPPNLKLALASDIESIGLSEFALPLEIRNKCRQGREVSGGHMMAYELVRVESSRTGEVIDLDGLVNVLRTATLRGSEMILSSKPVSKPASYTEPYEEVTRFVSDWSPKLESLRRES